MRRSILIDGRLIGYRHGGITNYVRQLATQLPSLTNDLNFELAVRRDAGMLSDRSIRAFTPPHHRFERLAFGLEVTARKPALLHAVDYIQPITPSVPSVVTVHDLAFLTNPNLVTPESFTYYSQVLHTLPEASRVIAVSEWTKAQITEHLPVNHDVVHVVPNGYDPGVFSPHQNNDSHRLARLHPRLAELMHSERPVVLTVGTLEPRKRHDILLRAFRDHFDLLCSHSGTKPILVVAGQTGWLATDTVRELRTLQRMDRAIWLRDVTNRELAALYRWAKLLVMPSVDEGFGIPVLEAMASGTPSLASNVGALPELVGDRGFLEDTADPERWSDKIGRILSDHEVRERRGRRSIEHAGEFTWRSTARKTLGVYRESLDG